MDAAGRVLLEPAVVLTQTEVRLMNDEAFWRRVEAAQREPRRRIELDEL